jgi:aminoglycoside phosphotransferase (APT) family kinase protein
MIPSGRAFEDWLRRRPGFEAARVEAVVAVEGGASNVTCRVALSGAPQPAVCLRLQRERGIFEPYDVLREGAVIAALAASPIPVPGVVALEGDATVLGAPFIVLEWIEAPHMGVAGTEASFATFTEMVVRIHGLDWRAYGLEFLGVPANAAEGIRREIEAVAARMPAFGCEGEPLLQRAVGALRANVPGDGELALCHGDINVFNYLFRAGQVVGVVDWEQARISDRRCDVGQLVALSHLKGAPFGEASAMPFVVAYESASGRELAQMAYFRARWLFELAVIYHGWVRFNGTEPWYSWGEVRGLLERALGELA